MFNAEIKKLNIAQTFCCCSINNFIGLVWMFDQKFVI